MWTHYTCAVCHRPAGEGLSGDAHRMLDEDQARVVAHDDGPAAVLAGAGSGKTRCTTERAVRRLVDCGLPGESMLLLTFTNKAAGEMRERIRTRLPADLSLPWIGTFHAYGSQLLRRHGRRIQVPPNATLMDPDDARRMLDAMLAGPFPDREHRQRMLALHDLATSRGLDVVEPGDLSALRDLLEAHDVGPVASARFIQRLRRYDGEKRRAGILDFADLILLPARLLRQDPALAEQLRGGLKDLTVDEAQDTDGAQFRLLSLLMPLDRTVLLVGDDDQAIYEWRHARPENMRDFIDLYQARVYRLERNYRSTPAIVGGGVSLVRHNLGRLEKNPYAVRAAPADDALCLCLHADAEGMAEQVADRIADRLKSGLAADQIAVLYRKNRLARVLEAALLRAGIPYWVKAGMDLLAYADVRMMLSAGRLAANPADARALSRLADLVPGLGARGVGRLLEAGASDPLAQRHRLSTQAAARVKELADAIDALRHAGPHGLLDWCEETPLFANWLRQRARHGQRPGASPQASLKDLLAPARSRMAAIQRAIRRRLDGLGPGADPALRWSSALEVMTAANEDPDADRPRVTLCSIHGAKGLEWPEVHLFGFSEGLMPMARDGEIANLAEERRLAYVAITRARNCLTLHHADRVDIGAGQGTQTVDVSRFLDEVRRGQTVRQEDCRLAVTAAIAGNEGRAPGDWLADMRRRLKG